MDRSFVDRNTASRARLDALLERLAIASLDRDLGEGWTVRSTLAHVAFWDRYHAARLALWRRVGFTLHHTLVDQVNDALVPQWKLIPGEALLGEVREAADLCDRTLAELDDTLIAQLVAANPRYVERELHRDEHIAQIERALSVR